MVIRRKRMRPKKIDLNNFTKVNSIEECDGYNSLMIIPAKLSDGTQLPPLYFRGGEHDLIIDITDELIWDKNSRISTAGTQEEYNKRVNWWFDNARNNDMYRELVIDTFNRLGFDVLLSWEKCKNWLKSCPDCDRKSYIHKFVFNWLKKGYTWQINRIKKERENERGY